MTSRQKKTLGVLYAMRSAPVTQERQLPDFCRRNWCLRAANGDVR